MVIVVMLRQTCLIAEMNGADFTDITSFRVVNVVNGFVPFDITFFNCVVRTKSTEVKLLIVKMNVFYVNTIMINGFKRKWSASWFTQATDESSGGYRTWG